MLEVYSKNVAVSSGIAIPMNNVALYKGTSAQLQGTSTIQINKCGIYEVTVSASGIATSNGTVEIQLYKDGVAVPNAVSAQTAADTTGIHALSFSTLVQVNHNNCACQCGSPTNLTVVNTGTGATYDIDVTVVRV